MFNSAFRKLSQAVSMSYESLRRNQEQMGYGALSGLFRTSPVKPHHSSFSRDQQRLLEWQRANAAKVDNLQKIQIYITTSFGALMHFFIYVVTPKFTTFKARCKAMAKHMDFATLCVIVFALCTLFIILLSRFIVDYKDVHRTAATPPHLHHPSPHRIVPEEDQDDTVTKPTEREYVYYDTNILAEAEEVVMEYETIDDLFQPTPFPVLSDHEEDILKPSGTDTPKSLHFNEWVMARNVQWMEVQIGQIIKLKDRKSNQYSTLSVQHIDSKALVVGIARTNCWLFCHETLDMVTSDRMVYLIEPTDSDTDPFANDVHRDEAEGSQSPSSGLDVDRLYQAMERINENHEHFKEWVEDQVAQIQDHRRFGEDNDGTNGMDGMNGMDGINEMKVNDAMKDVLTDYLDDKMAKLMAMLEHQQSSIQTITENVNRMQQDPQRSEYAMDNGSVRYDWESMEERMDSKIESVVRVQIDHLAQQIAEQIAKEMEAPSATNYDDQVIRGGDDHRILDDTVQRTEPSHTDWSYRVVSHSKLKRNKRDVLSEYGYWIIHHLFSKWNQQSISATYKPGDCTPLQFDASSSAYITIELYRPIQIRKVSLYHYHSPVLTQTAINAAPRDFQIWGSHNLTKWYDLGNFSYDYHGEGDTQYFEVAEMGSADEEEWEQDGDDTVRLRDDNGREDDEGERNGTPSVMAETNVLSQGVYEDYMNGFKFIAFRLLSNHGGSDYGCIYRLKVFGDAI